MTDRESVLGFKPQKETPYNKLLPYADKLDEESNKQLAEIKAQLARAVQLRDIKIGTSHWTGQLARYIRLYGLKFSKEDHVRLIHLLVELIAIPDLDYTLVQKFAQLLISLLKKRELLTRDDLELPWQPFHKILKVVTFSSFEKHGLILFPENVEQVLKSLVRQVRIYFPITATAEMLQEWRPLMCPFDMSMLEAMYFLELFLPTKLPPDMHHLGYKLWFDELIGLWDSCMNSPSWECHLVSLFARIANDALGYIDWNPWIPKIFTRVLRSLNLPVGASLLHVGRSGSSFDISITVWWIVGMMGGPHTTLDHVDQLFKALQSFYHPSNVGKWHTKLMKLMFKLPKTVVQRLHRERYKKSWEPPPPESHRLTDAEVTRFVDILKPIVYLAMFSKFGSHDSSLALQNLAILRPERVIPTLLEKTYPALETLTEPHRLTACLHCVVGVARQMLASHKWYPEGRSHVIPLLNLSLPGIDPNDIKKSLITFQLISTLASLVPLKDCSEALFVRSDLTEEERELCSASTQFEDFVLQFMDRIFMMIENSSHDHQRSDAGGGETEVKLNQEESLLEIGLLSTFNAIMQQSSEQIYHEALLRLHRFVTTSVFEIKVAGRFTGDLLRAAVKVNPDKALRMFVMHFCDIIKQRCAHEDISKEEHLDNEFLWSLKMLSEVVRCDAAHLVRYKDELLGVLQLCLHVKCPEAGSLASIMLRHLLRALTLTYANDYRSTTADWNQPITDNLPIRDWGKSGHLDDLGMTWHVPSTAELNMAQEILYRFLQHELTAINKHISGDKKMTREELRQSLSIINQVVNGAGSLLPVWDGEPLELVESLVPQTRFSLQAGVKEFALTLDNDKNVRVAIIETLRPLLQHMLNSSEDDTKTFNKLILVYSSVIFYHGTVKDDFDNRWKSLHVVKKSMENKLVGNKKHIRALLVDRAQLQHELRVNNCFARHFTSRHEELFSDLLKLSISRYSRVRISAQKVLQHGLHLYAYSYRCYLDELLACLKEDTDIDHDQFKGALYLINGNGKRSMVTKRSWEVMGKVWPAIICAHHSEKPSILGLMDKLMDKLHKNIEATPLAIQVHDELVQKAAVLAASDQAPSSSISKLTSQQLEEGRMEEAKRNQKWKQDYFDLIEKLVIPLEEKNLNWRFYEMGLVMLELLVRPDIMYPQRAVRLFTNNMVHETLMVRKVSINAVSTILKTQKRLHKKKAFDPRAQCDAWVPTADVTPGDRPDNMWHHYDGTNAPRTLEEYQAQVYVEKTHWGYYTWPQTMYNYAPDDEQPRIDRKLEDLRDEEKPIYECFHNQDFVEKLIGFLSLEENKGKDKFHSKYFTLFKGVFKNFGDSALELIKPHIERLVADTSHDKHDSSQRCAAETIAGLIRGSKHWGYVRCEAMWDWLLPLVRTLLRNMTVETITDWGTCFATASESRDPRKLARLFDVLMDDPLQGEDGGSFAGSSRMYVLQGALAQQEWRVPKLLHNVLDYVKPLLQHNYKNVRDRLGSVLVNLFLYDMKLPNSLPTTSPRRDPFILDILPRLQILREETTTEAGSDTKTVQQEEDGGEVAMDTTTGDGGDKSISASSPEDVELKVLSDVKLGPTNGVLEDGESEEKKAAIRLCKTSLKWLQGCFSRMFQCMSPEIFQFLPILCNLYSEGKDTELRRIVHGTVNGFSLQELIPEVVPTMLDTVQQICSLESELKDSELRRELQVAKACMAFMLLPAGVIPHAITILQQVSQMKSWHARGAILGYTQVMVFCNLFLMQEADIRAKISKLVMDLLCDDQLEVREMAAVTLGGLLHCGYMTVDEEMTNWKQQNLYLVETAQCEGMVEVEAARYEQTLPTPSPSIRLVKTAGTERVKGVFLKYELFYANHFLSLSSTRIKRSSRRQVKEGEGEENKKGNGVKYAANLIKRHAGVLGLCACVTAYPYDVPSYIPEILMTLSTHVDDPQPIQRTVKTTLSNFKRTHHDNWQDHRQMFTDDQLGVLTDLLVSPNYYA